MAESDTNQPLDFIRAAVTEDLKAGRYDRVHTRFPPEPNGYLHIGHAKAICIDFGIAAEFGGLCNLRFDDTNPVKEEVEYVDAIMEDIRWLGFDWEDRLFYASDYFEQLYECAVKLIRKGKAYVCDLSADEVREYRGTLTEPGKESPYRNRAVEENLDLFARMRAGEFPDGARTLRAKIDMASPNLNLRDPVMYRILHAAHHRTGRRVVHLSDVRLRPRPVGLHRGHHPLALLAGVREPSAALRLVPRRAGDLPPAADRVRAPEPHLHRDEQAQAAASWCRTATSGAGTTRACPPSRACAGAATRPAAIRDFCDRIGVAKKDSTVDIALLEHCLREDLNKRAPRVMAVLKPLRRGDRELPRGPGRGARGGQQSRGPRRRHAQGAVLARALHRAGRLPRGPAAEVLPAGARPRGAAALRLLHQVRGRGQGRRRARWWSCTAPTTRPPAAAMPPDGRKVKATLHWVSAAHAVPAEVRLYDRLFLHENPEDVAEGQDFIANLNPNSLEVLDGCWVEPSLAGAAVGGIYQFERQGYFCVDRDSSGGRLVFNRAVPLKDEWAKIERSQRKS